LSHVLKNILFALKSKEVEVQTVKRISTKQEFFSHTVNLITNLISLKFQKLT
jgi:hypothetical protein